MFRKRFYVKIEFQLHAITCPGVWLCKNGYLEATIKTLGYIFRTGAMEPRFPLLAHDQFTIEGYFKSVGSMEELENVLAAEKVEITLWQSGRRLAYFVGKLADVMQAGVIPKLTCGHNVNVQLLMKATPAFPGIIAPKLELSANVGVRDRLGGAKAGRRSSAGSVTSHRSSSYRGDFISPNFQNKATPKQNRHLSLDALNQTKKLPNCCDYLEPPRRQQPVCHARHFGCDETMENSSLSQFAPSTPRCSGNLFEANGIKHKNLQRRFSLCSSQSFALSQDSTNGDTSEYCTHTWNSKKKLQPNADEHQELCEICQSYRKAFLGLNT